MAEWQPIETAPRDGTRILFYTPGDEETGWLGIVTESHYDKHGLVDLFVPQWQDGLEPTHWMPLPDPPRRAHKSYCTLAPDHAGECGSKLNQVSIKAPDTTEGEK